MRVPVRVSLVWRGDGAAERAGLENRRPRKGSASSNLAPSANKRTDFFEPNRHTQLPASFEDSTTYHPRCSTTLFLSLLSGLLNAGGGVCSGMPTPEQQEVSAPSWETYLRPRILSDSSTFPVALPD
jgi:hypothetical protein